MRRILLFALLALLTTVFVSGCTVGSATDLYRLPETAKDYVNLAARTEEVLELGAEYCAPVKGSNRQSVQLVDLTVTVLTKLSPFSRSPMMKNLSGYISIAS